MHAGGGKIALKAGTREHKRREGQNCLLALRPVPWTLSNYRQSFGSERTGPNWTFGLPERLVLIGPARPEAKNDVVTCGFIGELKKTAQPRRSCGRGATLVEELTIEKEHAQKRVAVDQATAHRAGVGTGSSEL